MREALSAGTDTPGSAASSPLSLHRAFSLASPSPHASGRVSAVVNQLEELRCRAEQAAAERSPARERAAAASAELLAAVKARGGRRDMPFAF